MKEMRSKLFEQTLLHNGLDFIYEGLCLVEKRETRRMKYALLNVYSGVLLILKERLRLEHWSLLFRPRTEPDRKKFLEGDFPSVNFEETVKRLKKVLELEFNEQFEDEFEQIRKFRNKIEHFEFSSSQSAFDSLIAKAVTLALDFIENFLDPESFHVNEQETLRLIREKLSVSEDLVRENTERAKKLIDPSKEVIYLCYVCDQAFMVVEPGDGISCKFCGEKNDDPENAANLYAEKHSGAGVYHPKHNPDPKSPIIECPECGLETCVYDEYSDYYCFSCEGSSVDGTWSNCCECSELFKPYDEELICGRCMEWKMNED